MLDMYSTWYIRIVYRVYGIHKLHVMLQISLSTTDIAKLYGVCIILCQYNTIHSTVGTRLLPYILSEPRTGKL